MDEKLSEIIRRIVEEVDPEKIMLFGSRAKGDNRKDSDYDILVLKRNITRRGELEKKIYRKLFGTGVAVDVIVDTPERFETLKDKWFLVHSEIARFGEMVYEK